MRPGVQPGEGVGNQRLERIIDPVGGDYRLEQPLEILQPVEFGRAEEEPGEGNTGLFRRLRDPLGVVGRRIVPDQQLGNLRAHLAQLFEEGDAVVLAAALARQVNQIPALRIERAVNHPPPVALTDDDFALLGALGPTGAQRRELA